MKLQADHENKTCVMCLGILCKMCKNVSVKNKEICVDCEVAPLRNQKAHVIYNFLRREGACASIETLRDAYKLLKTAKKMTCVIMIHIVLSLKRYNCDKYLKRTLKNWKR